MPQPQASFSLAERSERGDRRHVGHRDHEMLLLCPNAELHRALDVILFRDAARRRVVHADVQKMDAGVVLRVEAADVRPRAARLQHDGHAVQRVMTRMKDVAAHRYRSTAAAQYLSKAATRSPAISCGERPSIWCRCMK